MLVELKDLNIVHMTLDLLLAYQYNPTMICLILSVLTNLSLNDSINIKLRLHGAHIIGKILMENCPVLIKDKLVREEKIKNGEEVKSYS